MTKETRFRKKLFGGVIEFVIYTDEPSRAKKVIEETYKEALRLQKIFNFFDKDSELSKLNQERKIKVSKELFEVVKTSLKFSKLTNGKYNVGLGKNIKERKTRKKISKTKASYKDIKMNSKTRTVTLENPDVLIDLGSIAKGYITDKISDFMKSRGIKNFLIDARGDILVSGDSFHIVEIQHPREKEKTVLPLKLKNQAVATSGDYMQFSESFEKSHIINQSEFVSVTVVAPTLELADVYATAIFVSGKRLAKKIADKNKKIKFMTIDKNLNAEFFNGWEEIIYES